jgi:hypothetical protein
MLALGLFIFTAPSAPSQQTDLQAQVLQGIDKAQEFRERCLDGYTVTEHYNMRNSRFSEPARITVKTTYRKGQGKSFDVISRSGPSLLKGRVFDSILRGESEVSRGAVRERSLITTANYHMRLLATEKMEGRDCYVVELEPKHRSSHVLKGRAWFTRDSYSLVRIEGRPAASVSFLTGRPFVTRDYQLFDGFWLAVKSHAHSQGFFAGESDLTIEYTGYTIFSQGDQTDGATERSPHTVLPLAP